MMIIVSENKKINNQSNYIFQFFVVNIQNDVTKNDSIDDSLLRNLKNRFDRGVIYVSSTEIRTIYDLSLFQEF